MALQLCASQHDFPHAVRHPVEEGTCKEGTCKEGTCKEGVDRGGRLRVDERRLWPELQDVAQLWLPPGIHHEHRSRHPLLVVNRQGFGPRPRHKNLRCTTCEILYNTITKLTPLTTALVIFIKHNQETALLIFIKHNLETALVIFIKHNQKTCQYRTFI